MFNNNNIIHTQWGSIEAQRHLSWVLADVICLYYMFLRKNKLH